MLVEQFWVVRDSAITTAASMHEKLVEVSLSSAKGKDTTGTSSSYDTQGNWEPLHPREPQICGAQLAYFHQNGQAFQRILSRSKRHSRNKLF